MGNSNKEEINSNDLIAKFKDQTAITVLIEDLGQTSKLMTSDVEKYLVSRIVKVLKESYAERERKVMTKFAFDFYADQSRQMQVREFMISENLTHAEIYFEEKFKKQS
jgi:hypothetical protein